jgi:hypothetical protein
MAAPQAAVPAVPEASPQDTFNIKINDILIRLGIERLTMDKLLREFAAIFSNVGPTKKIELIDNLDTQIMKLLTADDAIIRLETDDSFSKIKDDVKWKDMKQHMGKLQGLVLLRAVSTKDCDTIMKSLTDAVSGKLKAVNEVLEANITQDGGGNRMNEISMYNKYLKYKAKYLSLKK